MKTKSIKSTTSSELATILGLSPFEGIEMEIKGKLTDEIIKTVNKRKITHQQLATLSGSSRTRITAILNRNLYQVSADLLLKILASLGVKTKVSFSHPKAVA